MYKDECNYGQVKLNFIDVIREYYVIIFTNLG